MSTNLVALTEKIQCSLLTYWFKLVK